MEPGSSRSTTAIRTGDRSATHGASASDSTPAHLEPHVEDAGVGELPAGRPDHRRDSGARGISSTKRTGHLKCAVAEELVDVSPGIDDGGHDVLEQGVEAGNRVLGGVPHPGDPHRSGTTTCWRPNRCLGGPSVDRLRVAPYRSKSTARCGPFATVNACGSVSTGLSCGDVDFDYAKRRGIRRTHGRVSARRRSRFARPNRPDPARSMWI
jgi:hypothetical protein